MVEGLMAMLVLVLIYFWIIDYLLNSKKHNIFWFQRHLYRPSATYSNNTCFTNWTFAWDKHDSYTWSH